MLKQAQSLVKSIDLIWIVVDDFHKAVAFYTEVVGLKVLSSQGDAWAELAGPQGGAMLGIAKRSECCPLAPGQNAVMTLTVENLDMAVEEFRKKNAKLVGDIIEVPGHVRMQLFVDPAGNHAQLVQNLDIPTSHHHHDGGGCCKHK